MMDKQYPDLVHWPEAADEDPAPPQDEPDEWTQQDEDNWVYQQITK
jgi:hypothetical protein